MCWPWGFMFRSNGAGFYLNLIFYKNVAPPELDGNAYLRDLQKCRSYGAGWISLFVLSIKMPLLRSWGICQFDYHIF